MSDFLRGRQFTEPCFEHEIPQVPRPRTRGHRYITVNDLGDDVLVQGNLDIEPGGTVHRPAASAERSPTSYESEWKAALGELVFETTVFNLRSALDN